MMTDMNDIPTGVDERAERLICRVLDGEADAGQRAELASLLLRDPAAKALFDDYQRVDQLSASALRRDLAGARPVVVRRRFSGLTIGAAGALVTAAAVVAISLLPSWLSSNGAGRGGQAVPTAGMVPGAVPALPPQMIRSPNLYEYSEIDHQPARRLQDFRQDFIGIPSKNKNQIYIFERNKRTTTLVPVSGDI
jgi:hypothetical protein